MNNTHINKYKNIEDRVITLGQYIINTNGTVREVGDRFKIGKSTVHKDLTERLIKINPRLFVEVKNVLEMNKMERAIRGGIATRRKYLLN